MTILIKTAARDRKNRKVLRNSWITDVQQLDLSYAFLIGESSMQQLLYCAFYLCDAEPYICEYLRVGVYMALMLPSHSVRESLSINLI